MEYEESLELAIDNARANMPERISKLAALCDIDLYYGPCTYDAASLSLSCDDDAKAFPFRASCDEISAWVQDNISDIQMEAYFDEETGESYYEPISGSSSDILRGLFGNELARYL